jgi:hypothetical protein
MSYKIADFSSQIALTTKIHKWYANRAAELNAIAAALTTDPTRRSAEMETGPVQILRPGHHLNTRFTNDIMLIVNAGKAGNLTPLAMGNAITAGLANEIPPVNTTVPALSGTGTVGQVLTVTNGNWTYTPSSYTYVWRRGATTIGGAAASTYTLVAADSGTTITCIVTAHNAAGATAAPPSNGIACA